MADTLAQRIVAAVVARLQAITVNGGYQTGAGARVYQNRASLDAETGTFPALLVYDQGEEIEPVTPQRHRCRLTLAVRGFQRDTNTRALVGDVKKAVLLADGTLGGLAHHLYYEGFERDEVEDGSRLESVTITFVAEYDETYGDPYTAI